MMSPRQGGMGTAVLDQTFFFLKIVLTILDLCGSI